MLLGINIIPEDAYGKQTQGVVEFCDGVNIFGVNAGLFEPFKTTEASDTIFNETHGEVFESILKAKGKIASEIQGSLNLNFIQFKVKGN